MQPDDTEPDEANTRPQPTETSPTAPGEPEPNPSRVRLIIGIVASVALLGALAGLMLVRRGEPVATAPPGTAAVEGTSVTNAVTTVTTATTATTATSTTVPSSTVPTTSGSTAASFLAPFITEAKANDTRLRAAEAAVKGSFHENEIVIEQSTIDMKAGTFPTGAATLIPAGLAPDVEQAALLVYSGLESRSAAIRFFGPVGNFPNDSTDAANIRSMLRDDSATAARFTSDIQALQAVAARTPMTAAAAPDTRPAAEVAVRVAYTNGQNACCASNGGYLATAPIPITWFETPTTEYPGGLRLDGLAGDIAFQADYDPTNGWTVRLNAG